MQKIPNSKKVAMAKRLYYLNAKKEMKAAPSLKKTSTKAPVKESDLCKGKTVFVCPNQQTVALITDFYFDVIASLKKFNGRKKPATREQVFGKFKSIANKWAVEIDKSLGKANIMEFSFSLPAKNTIKTKGLTKTTSDINK